MIGTTKSKGMKDTLDRFYTKPEIAQKCVELIKNLNEYDAIIEPSAGSGSFSNLLPCIAFDISPAADNIRVANWFEVDKTAFPLNSLVIGNPPFGQQNTLAISFFNESAKFCSTIAFILPLSFKKQSVQDKLDKNFWLIEEWILPKNSFDFEGQDYDVPCVFQIWERRETTRPKLKQITTTNLFLFVKDKDSADFRIQRVGGNAGKAFYNLEVSAQSNYFIKNTSNYSNDELMQIINTTIFPEVEYTVGPKSLSKTELITTLEKRIKEGV